MKTVDTEAVVASSTAPQMAKAQAESAPNGKANAALAATRKVKAAKPVALKKAVSAKQAAPVKKTATAKKTASPKKVAAVKPAPTSKLATAAAGDAAKKSNVTAKAPAAKKVDAVKAASVKSKDVAPKDDKKKKKVVRDSFTMPESDYQKIAELKRKCMSAGISAKKSELLRAGLQALSALPIKRLIEVVAAVENLKTGRPGKGE